MEAVRTGILLINLGTPESTKVSDVRRYLREFLSDPRVIDLPGPARKLLVEGVILPRRPRASAEAYRKIWTPEGSPLLVHGRALRAGLAEVLGGAYVVELAMRYGTPSIRGALARLCAADVARILVLPLFPQYAQATVGSALAKLEEELSATPELPPHEVLRPFHAERRFVAAWREVAQPELEAFRPDHVQFSYHGLPERQVRAGDASRSHCLERTDCCDRLGEVNRSCYRAQCFATSRALAAALELPPERTATSFQSRLGRARWIEPDTELELGRLVAAGHRRLAVLCPAFVADCLETLEEIGIRARARWQELGGEELRLVPSLNAHPAWIDAIAHWIRSRA